MTLRFLTLENSSEEYRGITSPAVFIRTRDLTKDGQRPPTMEMKYPRIQKIYLITRGKEEIYQRGIPLNS